MVADIAQFLIETMDDRRVAVQIALQCAPVLAGVKISNIIIIKK